MITGSQLYNNNKQVVIRAENLSVSYVMGNRTDDFKSKFYDFIFRRETDKKTEFWPLRNINFEGYKGEILGIIGSNGSGKTTLCKVISGILKSDEGSIHVNGKVTALFSLGMGFNKELTGRENVYLNAMMIGINKEVITHLIDDIKEFSDIGVFFDQRVKYYSSGMKARLGFSVAAHIEPEILVVDEALNTGDLKFTEKAAVKIKSLVKKAKIVILVTHSLSYAEKYCDRIIWIEKGIIKAVGEANDIIGKYKTNIPEKKSRRKNGFELNKIETCKRGKRIIEVSKMSLSYKINKKEHWALKNINFSVDEGEVIGIIGHNGAGKSTLCKVLTNILAPNDGTVRLNGKTTALLKLGSGFNQQLSGRDNIYLNGMLLGIPKKKISKLYNNIVEFSELGNYIDKPLKTYSSGMKSRLGFSIIASLQPDIFVIDEALSTGDRSFRQKASEKMQEMIGKAKAVIIVSHSMSFIEKMCSRVIWMEQGIIRYDGEPQEAIRKYKAQTKKNK